VMITDDGQPWKELKRRWLSDTQKHPSTSMKTFHILYQLQLHRGNE